MWWRTFTSVNTQSTETTYWRAVLVEQGRTITWLAKATGRPRRTLYAYSQGHLVPTREWLAAASKALGVEVTA